MTCYTVKAENHEMYLQLFKLLRKHVTIFTADEKTFVFSISEPSYELIDTLRKIGADVTIDYHYEFE